jgi:predicted nucleic acid-binding protein
MLVVDASALAGWLMPEGIGTDLSALAGQHEIFMAPWLLWVEIRNILIVSERRGRIPATLVEQALDAIEALGIVLDTAASNAAVLALSRRHGLTAYDALYLDLALRHGAALATRDTALAKAARAEGLVVV